MRDQECVADASCLAVGSLGESAVLSSEQGARAKGGKTGV